MPNNMPRGSSSYLPNLTGVRGLAAAWVLALHVWQFSGAPALTLPMPGLRLDFTPLFKCGYFGVDLFFVLSGFLLSMPFHRAVLERKTRPSLKQFWIHRCRRVLPAYWLQLAILAAIFFWLGQTEPIAPRILAAHVLLVQNIAPWPVPLLNPVYWSMPVEWDFYIVLPLLAWFIARCRWPIALLFALVFACTFRLLCYWSLKDSTLSALIGYGDIQQLPARIDQFFIGVCAAWIAANRPQSTRTATACLLTGMAAIVTMAYVAAPRGDFLVDVDVPYVFFHHSLTAAAFGLLVLGAAGPTRIGTVLYANQPMTFLGVISYSLYLWHYPMLSAMQQLGWMNGAHAAAWIVVLFAALPAIVLVSWLSYRYVEKPFLRAQATTPHVTNAKAA